MTAAAAFFIRTPYSLLTPGSAVDLRGVIRVNGYGPPAERFDLTDVSVVQHVPPLILLGAVLPGAEVIRTSDVIPQQMTDRQYDRLMVDSMADSQRTAIYVAERAAGYRMPPLRERAVIAGVLRDVPAAKELRPGDAIVAIDGKPTDSVAAVQAATRNRRSGEVLGVTLLRDGKRVAARVPLTTLGGRARMGIYLAAQTQYPKPPVPVTFELPDVSGSSGGLMFAIDIYRSLVPDESRTHVAGTGTIDVNGNVGEIAGAKQKIVAARNAGATVFLVPAANYPDVRGTPGIQIIPVKTFAQALVALNKTSTSS